MKLIVPVLAAGLLAAGFVSLGAEIAPAAVAATSDYYTAYYDGFYGAFTDGYWGTDGTFWYMTRSEKLVRDDGHHFQHDPGPGLTLVQGSHIQRLH